MAEEILNVMDAETLIATLQKIVSEEGNLGIVITGCYGSSGDLESVYIEKESQYLRLLGGFDKPLIVFTSDICSG